MAAELTLLAPAKLNLFLHIVGRRSDGYHELQTLFQLLNYGDTLHFRVSDNSQLNLSNSIPGVADQDNLILKAANSLQLHTRTTQGVNIHIDKQLPMGGGLGGGSSNAATTLVALNYLWQTGLTVDELCDLGVALGADVPVFIRGRSSWAEGIGEQLQAIDLPEHWYLIIKPDCHVSTADIFSHEELTRDSAAITVAAFFEQGGHNDCESVVCAHYPAVKNALDWLNHHASAQLTGTGACIFAAFGDEQTAHRVQQQVPKHWHSFVAKGMNQSPVLPFLLT